MRLLFLSNFYPPYSVGGYEMWCQETAEQLSRRGHRILVLTSRHGSSGTSDGPNLSVYRRLTLEMELSSKRNVFLFFIGRARRQQANVALLCRLITEFAPDAIVVWGMWNLTMLLPIEAERLLPERVVYYLGDYWPSLPNQWWNYWEAPTRHGVAAAPKRWLRTRARDLLAAERLSLPQFRHALFPSEFMRHAYDREGIHTGRAAVIPGGVDVEPYYRAAAQRVSRPSDSGLRLLYAGRLIADKGAHTAVEALSILAEQYSMHEICLTISGGGEDTYIAGLHTQIMKLGLHRQVRFLDWTPQEKMPQLYCAHDIFVFPSGWPEPFGRVLVEAMAAGMTVVGTTVGGASEILRDGETGLAFPAGDPAALAAQIARVARDADLRMRLAKHGQDHAIAHFSSAKMVRGIELYLEKLVSAA